MSDRIFLLSPADCSGKRARSLRRAEAEGELARRLREEGAELGEVFSFVSSLYFRGKLAYARTFARAPEGRSGVFVITAGDGLATPETRVRTADLERFAAVPIDLEEPLYARPVRRDLQRLSAHWQGAEIVLLGSIATGKYSDLLAPVLGTHLLFPAEFVGRGDMSRGGLMLRAVEAREELRYVPLLGATRRGARPARLAPKARRSSG